MHLESQRGRSLIKLKVGGVRIFKMCARDVFFLGQVLKFSKMIEFCMVQILAEGKEGALRLDDPGEALRP